jgi:hypothetical protein
VNRGRAVLFCASAALLAIVGCSAAGSLGSSESMVTAADGAACPAVVPAPEGGTTSDSSPPNSEAGPALSLRADVMPIFGFSCSFSSCHGDDRPDRVFLGPRPGDGDVDAAATTVRSALVGAPLEVEMAMVVPFRPDQSFLMYKLDGDFCPIAAQCSQGVCGASMPKGSRPLDPVKRDKIRQWIAQGALDN